MRITRSRSSSLISRARQLARPPTLPQQRSWSCKHLSLFFFFFKQKTAYEIADVTGVQTCALPIFGGGDEGVAVGEALGGLGPVVDAGAAEHFLPDDFTAAVALGDAVGVILGDEDAVVVEELNVEIGRASCRERV